jgi:hypothetical protein
MKTKTFLFFYSIIKNIIDMARHKTWREIATPIVFKTLEATKGQSEKEIRAALKAAYPFGERSMHPYKVWCDEIQRQRKNKNNTIYNPNQISLFND